MDPIIKKKKKILNLLDKKHHDRYGRPRIAQANKVINETLNSKQGLSQSVVITKPEEV